MADQQHPITPPPASRPVTLATVGEDFYRNSPIARAAVLAAISEAELIRYLLEHERRLTELATDALHRAAPRTLMVPPKHHGLGYEVGAMLAGKLLAAMRPKPPSLVRRALHILGTHGDLSPKEHDTIRQALEHLDG